MGGPNGESQFGAKIPADQILNRRKLSDSTTAILAEYLRNLSGHSFKRPPGILRQDAMLVEASKPIKVVEALKSLQSPELDFLESAELKPIQSPDLDPDTRTYWHSERPNGMGEVFDSPDEIVTKEAIKQYLISPHPAAVRLADLPVQHDNLTAKRFYHLYYRTLIEGDSKQGIESTLYKADNGKIIFCRDASNYEQNKEMDSCYSYARDGIGFYVSQHLLYNIHGAKGIDTDFIADNAEKFYNKFIGDIHSYREGLPATLSPRERRKKLKNYACEYLSYVADKVAEELTEKFGQHYPEAFGKVELSRYSLGKIVPAASTAFVPIPHFTHDTFTYTDPNIPELSDISANYGTAIHPKPGKMTDEIKKEWYDDANPKFLAPLHASEQGLFHYLKEPLLKGTVTLPSQYRSKIPGLKNGRRVESMHVLRQNGQIELPTMGSVVGSSTVLTAFQDAAPETLIQYNKMTLLQEHAMMVGEVNNENPNSKRGVNLCFIGACGIDFATPALNRFLNKSIVPLDSKAVTTTKEAVKEIAHEAQKEEIFFNNITLSEERFFKYLQKLPESMQKFVAKITNYEDLQTMLSYIRDTAGIDDNIIYIDKFKTDFAKKLTAEDSKRLEIHLGLMRERQQLQKSRTLDKLEILEDTIAMFVKLCNLYNELILKYDERKEFNKIVVSIKCISGNNRTRAALKHYVILSRVADIIEAKFGVDELKNLFDKKYYPLRRAVGDDFAKKSPIEGLDSTLGMKGIRLQSEGSLSRIHFSKEVRENYICLPEADCKGLGDIYISCSDRVDILTDPLQEENDDSIILTTQDNPTPFYPSIQADYIPEDIDQNKPSLAKIVLDKIGALVPKEIGLIEKHLGLDFFTAQPKSVDPVVQNNPANEVIVSNSGKTDLPGGPHLDLPSTQQTEKMQPARQKQKTQQKRKSDLTKGSIIASVGMVVAALVTFIVEAHSGISLLGAASLIGAAITGWFYAGEEKSSHSAGYSRPYSSSPTQTLFSPSGPAHLVPVVHDSNELPRPG